MSDTTETTVQIFDASTGEHLSTETVQAPLPLPMVDVVSLAQELTEQRARLDAAEDALDHLIVASLDGSL